MDWSSILKTIHRRTGFICAWLSMFIGFFFFMIWQLGLYSVAHDIYPNWAISYGSAFCLFLSACSFLTVIYPIQIPLYRWLALPVFVFASCNLCSHFFNLHWPVEELLEKTLLFPPAEAPRMLFLDMVNFISIKSIKKTGALYIRAPVFIKHFYLAEL